MSAVRWRRALSVFPELKVANFALLLSVRRIENRINVSVYIFDNSCAVVQINKIDLTLTSSLILTPTQNVHTKNVKNN